MALGDLFTPLLDLLLPPRPTERVVRALTLRELQQLVLRGEFAGSLPYHDPRVTALVWELKYYASSRAAALGGAVLGELLLDIGSESLGTPLLIPIPMSRARRAERGFNQTELLCKAALPQGYQYAPGALVRERNTAPQQGLPRHTRLDNVKNSMRAPHPARVAGRTCIVVDDVSTTGATLGEARRALLNAGAAQVECVALAHS